MKCPTCKGSGFRRGDERWGERCATCKGRGTVCDHCGGSGAVPADDLTAFPDGVKFVPCRECGGSGEETKTA